MTDGVLNAGKVAKVVLLACGSFSPVTNMHLRMFGRLCWYCCITTVGG